MSRALQPFTPLQDLEARRRWSGPAIAGVLTEELADFCQGGVSIIIAARSARGLPVAGIALACRITPAGEMRIFLREPANVPVLAALDKGSPLAVTFSQPRTHRSIQVKTPRAGRAEIEDGDLDAIARKMRLFEDELVLVNYSRRLAAFYCAYRDDEVVSVAFRPTDAFVQTPGPGAGEQLA